MSVTETASAENVDNQIKHANQKSTVNFKRIFKDCTGYELHNFTKLTNFTNWLHRPVDGSALGIFRMLFGFAMLIDIAEERGGRQLDVRYGERQHCHFPLINGIKAASYPHMGCIYLCMWLGALGITLGYRFRVSCLAFIVPYWYIFLLDKPSWNNHSYLFGLVGSMLLFSDANCFCSVDRYLETDLSSSVPYWNYFLIKFQFFLLYTYAGLKKFNAEWLSGFAMSSLGRHWLFGPFRLVLSIEMIDLLIIHWFTAVFDFAIAFLMTWERSRLWATPFMVSFHLMNSRLFLIGMFPWVCLAEVPLFYGFDWPHKISLKKTLKALADSKGKSVTMAAEVATEPIADKQPKEEETLPNVEVGNSEPHSLHDLRTTAILVYCALQLFLPYSHFITKGYNNWTDGLYGYSWNMMVHSYDTILTSVKIVDNDNGQIHYLDPFAFTEYDRWTKSADMALQYAKCIESNILEDYAKDPTTSPLSSTNFSIYFDIWCSMNGRFQQRVFDPRVDLLKAKWSPFQRTAWSLPLLNELNYMRPKLKTITNEVLMWNNFSDVIFVADFPGLTLDNYISPELTNVSLTILEGNVRYKSDDERETYFLTAGNSFALNPGHTHHVTTIGLKPSCYLYTYENKTMVEQQMIIDEAYHERKPKLPLRKEFNERVQNYGKFLMNIANCLLHLLFDEPIPMEVRERD